MSFRGAASTLELDDDFGFNPADHWTPPVVRKQSTDPATIAGQLRSALALDDRNVFASNDSSHDARASNWLVRAQERVDAIVRELGRAQPTEFVRDSTKQLLSVLFLTGLKPSRIIATAHGGISVWFIRERYRLHFEISNEASNAIVLSETRGECAPRLLEISLEHNEILGEIKKVLPFLQS